MQRLMTREEVADTLGVHPNTIDHWRRQGRFPQPVRFPGGRTIRWRPGDVERWVADQLGAEAQAPRRRGQRKSAADRLA